MMPILIRTSRENVAAVEVALRQILYCDKYDGKGCGWQEYNCQKCEDAYGVLRTIITEGE